MTGTIAALYRHPVKGFTPEPVENAVLSSGAAFPGDRLWAVENGPSGFDPAAPAWVSKMKFTVLAAIPGIASIRTRWDAQNGRFHAQAPGAEAFSGDLSDATDAALFALWLSRQLGEDVRGELRVLAAPGHRFTDHPLGHVSVLNLASVRDLEARLGQRVDPLRFRANIWVEGWPAWAENAWVGRDVRLGAAKARVFSQIVRCAATCVDPDTAERDVEIPAALKQFYDHLWCGVYVHVTQDGALTSGDPAGLV